MYERNYSFPSSSIKLPGGTSPYKNFNRQRTWEKVLFRLPVGLLARVLFPSAWADNTFLELMQVLRESGVNTSKKMRFLDTGCFEGQLLDQIRDATCWEYSGLEPNNHAVIVAKGKGHRVWCGHAENADSLIPAGTEFDIIYNEGISKYADVVNAGVRYNVVTKAGSWYNYGEQKLGQGVEGSRQFLKENPKVEKEIVTKIKEAAVLEA